MFYQRFFVINITLYTRVTCVRFRLFQISVRSRLPDAVTSKISAPDILSVRKVHARPFWRIKRGKRGPRSREDWQVWVRVTPARLVPYCLSHCVGIDTTLWFFLPSISARFPWFFYQIYFRLMCTCHNFSLDNFFTRKCSIKEDKKHELIKFRCFAIDCTPNLIHSSKNYGSIFKSDIIYLYDEM